MPIVNVQGFGTVQFPDEMAPDAIEAAIRADIEPLIDQRRRIAAGQAAAQIPPVSPTLAGLQGAGSALSSAAGSVVQGGVSALTSPLKLAGTIADRIRANVPPTALGPQLAVGGPQSALTTGAEAIQQAAERIAPTDPAVEQTFFGGTLPQGLGNAGAMLATGGLAGLGAKAAGRAAQPAAVAGATAVGFTAEFDDAFQRAVQAGQDPDTALAKSLGYAGVAAAIENKLGMGRVLRKYFGSADEAAKALTARGVSQEFLKDALAGFGEEASQRVAQDVIIEGKLDPKGIVEEGAAGGIIQALMGLPALNRQAVPKTGTAQPPVTPDVTPPAKDAPKLDAAALKAAMEGNRLKPEAPPVTPDVTPPAPAPPAGPLRFRAIVEESKVPSELVIQPLTEELYDAVIHVPGLTPDFDQFKAENPDATHLKRQLLPTGKFASGHKFGPLNELVPPGIGSQWEDITNAEPSTKNQAAPAPTSPPPPAAAVPPPAAPAPPAPAAAVSPAPATAQTPQALPSPPAGDSLAAPLTPPAAAPTVTPATPSTVTPGTAPKGTQAEGTASTSLPPEQKGGAEPGENPGSSVANSFSAGRAQLSAGQVTRIRNAKGVPRSSLTERDGVLYTFVHKLGHKLPYFKPNSLTWNHYKRLKAAAQALQPLTPQGRAFLAKMERIVPVNFEDNYGPDGELMEAAYKAAQRAGLATELFTEQTAAKFGERDTELDALRRDTGKDYTLRQLFELAIQTANEHAERVSGRAEARLDAEAEAQVKADERFKRDQRKASPSTELIPPDDLREGMTYTLKGTKLRVTEVQVDDDGRVVAVQLEDGKQYMTQRLYAEDGSEVPALRADTGSAVGTASQKRAEQQDGGAFSRRSDRDAEYLAAVERGDLVTAQRMVDEAAKAAGYSRKLFHQTHKQNVEAIYKAGFNISNGKARLSDEGVPDGIFLKNDDRDIGVGGVGEDAAQIPVFAKIVTPLFTNSREDLQTWARANKEFSRLVDEIKALEKYNSQKFERLMKEKRQHARSGSQEYEVARKATEQFLSEWDAEIQKLAGKARQILTTDIKSEKFDGVIIATDTGSLGRKAITTIVFDPSQIKSADPVTYDDQGKVIPLSKRFNPESNDIRNSRAEAAAEPAVSVASAQARADELTAKWVLPFGVEVVQSWRDLPARARRGITEQDGHTVEGRYVPGSGVFLVADNLASPDRVAAVVLHEVLGHFGIDTVLGEQRDAFMLDVFRSFQGKPLFQQKARDYAGDFENGRTPVTPADKILLGRELVAALAENPAENPGLWQRIVDAVRRWLREIGWVQDVTEADIREALRRADRELRGVRSEELGVRSPGLVNLGGGVLMTPGAQLVDVRPDALAALTAHHGTPHKVDRFTTAKIGTGEGAQVYGWGLYFAENPKVAEEYRRNLAGKPDVIVGDRKEPSHLPTPDSTVAARIATLAKARRDLNHKFTPKDIVEEVARQIDASMSVALEAKDELIFGTLYRQKMALARMQDEGIDIGPSGSTYTVTLNVEPEDLLDWDKPLSEQSEKVRSGLQELGIERKTVTHPEIPDPDWGEIGKQTAGTSFEWNPNGRQAYDLLSRPSWKDRGNNPSEMASRLLANVGIKGIRYLDQGSRGQWRLRFRGGGEIAYASEAAARKALEAHQSAGNSAKVEFVPGTYNYVIFNEDDIRITHENGQPVAAGAFSRTTQPNKSLARLGAWLRPSKAAEVSQQMALAEPDAALASELDEALAEKPWRSIDEEYLQAINTENWAKAQAMVDAAARAAGYNIGPVFHGRRAKFNAFDERKLSYERPAFYFTSSFEVARTYGPDVVRVFLRLQNPWTAQRWQDTVGDTQANRALRQDWGTNDGFVIPNTQDSLLYNNHGAPIDPELRSDVYGVYNPEQIKLADAVTTDDSGRVILLSERFDLTTQDMRFSRTATPNTPLPDLLARRDDAAARGITFAAQREKLRSEGKTIPESLKKAEREQAEIFKEAMFQIMRHPDYVAQQVRAVDAKLDELNTLKERQRILKQQGTDLESDARARLAELEQWLPIETGEIPYGNADEFVGIPPTLVKQAIERTSGLKHFVTEAEKERVRAILDNPDLSPEQKDRLLADLERNRGRALAEVPLPNALPPRANVALATSTTLAGNQDARTWWESFTRWARNLASATPEIPLFGPLARLNVPMRGFLNAIRAGNMTAARDAEAMVQDVVQPLLALPRTQLDPNALARHQAIARKLQAAERQFDQQAERMRAEIAAMEQMRADRAAITERREALAEFDGNPPAKIAELQKQLAEAVDKLGTNPMWLFKQAVLFRDYVSRYQMLAPKQQGRVKFPGNLSIQDVVNELERTNAAIEASPARAAIKEAMDRHYRAMAELEAELLKRGHIIPEAMKNGAYFPHQVLDYTSQHLGRLKPATGAPFRGYLVDPTGSRKAIETDYIQAVYRHAAEVMAHNAHQDAVEKFLKPWDKSDSIGETVAAKAAAEGRTAGRFEWRSEDNLPPGYVFYDAAKKLPLRLGYVMDPQTIADALGIALKDGDVIEQMRKLGVDFVVEPEMLQQALVAGEKQPWVIPKEMAEALDGILERQRQEDAIARAPVTRRLRQAVALWKLNTLFAPWHYLRYEWGNTMSDVVDKLGGADPGMAKYLPQAFREVIAFADRKEATKDIRAAFEQRVLDSVTFAEVEKVKDSPAFEQLRSDTQRALGMVGTAAKNITFPPLPIIRLLSGANVRSTVELSRLREATFRYAKFLADLNRIRNGERPVYAGAYWKDVEGERTPEEKAAFIARRTFGDYGDMSVAGEYLRRNLVPFWSWTEINFRYHVNLLRNMADMIRKGEFGDAAQSARAIAAWTALRLALPYAAVHLWNTVGGAMAGAWDDDDDLEATLSDADRRRFHLILGKDERGQTKVIYMPTAFSDVVSWFGGDNAARLLAEYARGDITFERVVGDFAKQIGPDTLNKVAQSTGPIGKGAFIAVSGKQPFPDITNMRSVSGREKWFAVVQTMTDREGTDLLRRAFDNDYYPRPASEVAQQLILQIRRRDPEQWAFYEVKEKVSQWNEQKTGKRFEAGDYQAPEAQALRGFRRAVYLGDVDAAERFYNRLLGFGYTSERLKASIRNQHPLAELNEEGRKEFIKGLSRADREQLRRALQYWERLSTLKGKERGLFPAKPGQRFTPQPERLRNAVQSFDRRSDEDVERTARRLMDAALTGRR